MALIINPKITLKCVLPRVEKARMSFLRWSSQQMWPPPGLTSSLQSNWGLRGLYWDVPRVS